MQLGDLVAAGDVDDVVDDLEPERLVQAGGEAFPADLAELVVEPRDDPHVAVPGAESGPAIAEEVEPAKADRRVPGIVGRQADVVDDVGELAGGGEARFRFDRLRPAWRAALDQRFKALAVEFPV